MKRTDDKTLIAAMRILARDIESGDGVANAAIAEAATRLEELTTWRPIETAPRDRTPILVYMPEPDLGRHVHSAQFMDAADGKRGVSLIGHHFAFDAPAQPTHWLPPPDAPTASEGGEG